MTSPNGTPDPAELSDEIRRHARDIGFDLVGITPSVTPIGFHRLQDWLRRGFAGEMSYIERRERAYESPDHVLDGTRSVVMLGLNYRTDEPAEHDNESGRISRYAWGSDDYHHVIRGMLRQLADRIHQLAPGCRTRGVVDTAPLLERDFAVLAGLGWFGKNTMLINKWNGSWLFLAGLLTDLELASDDPHMASHCGTCTLCLDACPTDAFPEPWVLDARRCISYLTIELRNRPVPVEFRRGVQNWIFGCDVCQDVCPWNRHAPVSPIHEFTPSPGNSPADCVELLRLSPRQFDDRFGRTPLSRPGRAGILRNAAIVLGNSGCVDAIPALAEALEDNEPLVRGAAAWALGEIRTRDCRAALESRQAIESDETVAAEIASALATIQESVES